MLGGLRVVELEGLGPAPFASMMLADLGADVIVVHRKGEAAVGMPERSLLDRGKRSIALDLKNPSDVENVIKLLKTADTMIEGFRPGVLERLGLGPDVCHSFNPRLVIGRMTGWGQESPLSHTAGHDVNYLSMSGAAWYSGLPDAVPFPPPVLVGDVGGGALYLVIGLLAGVMKARETGQGTVVDASIYDGSAHMMNLLMALRQSGNWPNDRRQTLLNAPHWSHCYRTSDDGYMSVQCLEPKFYELFIEKLGLASDASFQQQYERSLWPELTRRLRAIFASKTRDEWTELFWGTDACVAPVLNPEEALAHPMNEARQTWRHADGILQAAPAPRFSNAATWSPAPLPARNANAKEILEEITSYRRVPTS